MDKKAMLDEMKELLKSKGKEELLETAEDTAVIGWELVKIVAKHSDNKLDDMAVAAGDSVVKELIDKIDGKDDPDL